MQLSVRGIEKAYDGRSVLSDISFELQSRDRALLLGPSGSGKSTLLNVICGLQSPDAGEVQLGEETISELGKGDGVRRRHMGIIFQTLRLVSALSVKANLALAQRLQTGSTDATLVEQTLERLGIADRANARPYELSQGEAQRAAIARAVVVKPDILIADEPTSALDQANTEVVAQLLVEMSEAAEATLLIATHAHVALIARTQHNQLVAPNAFATIGKRTRHFLGHLGDRVLAAVQHNEIVAEAMSSPD